MFLQAIQNLFCHGMIVFLFGLLCGVPFWLAIIRDRDYGRIRAWRVAHTTLISCGLFMLVAGLLLPQLPISGSLSLFLAICLVLSGYGFVFAMVMGAATGKRGLTPKPFGFNTVLFLGHFIGATGAMIGASIVLYGLIFFLL